MAPRLDFVDVSHWQSDRGTIDWAEVAKAGILGVIVKATEGTTYKDPDFPDNYNGAIVADLKVATYHFLKHGSVDAQMDHYLNTVNPAAGERLVIDYEDVNLGYADLKAAVAYLRTHAPHCEISVYGSAKLTDDVRAVGTNAVADMAGTSAWMARYSSSQPAVATNAWPSWAAWQYSQTGSVPGINGDVDLNTFNGSREACAQWIGPPTEEPVEPAPEAPVITVTVPRGTIVNIVEV